MISSAYLRLLIFLLAMLISALLHPGILHDVLIQAWWQYTALTYSFPNFEPVHCSMSSSNCCILTFLQDFQEIGKVVWYSHLFKNSPQFVVIYTVKGFDIINEAEVDVFPDLPCFFHNPTNVGNLISASSAFSKSSLYICILCSRTVEA